VSKFGYRVRNGVEFDDKGQHVAYYVRVGAAGQHRRVLARGPKSGMLMAYMIYGKKNDIEAKRGMPLLAVVLERAKMLDRYLGAALGAAEERQKIPYFFTHNEHSDGSDPQEGIRAKAFAGNASAEADIPVLNNGDTKVTNVAISAEKTVYDLSKGVDVKAIDSKQEIDVPGFGSFNIKLICAGVNIPAQVAMSDYDGSFSSNRMAGKDYEHTFMTERADFACQYIDPIYSLQLYLLILNNYVPAMGYIEAIESGNDIVCNAFTSCRWVGDKFPDIDPLKTANYLRKMLGDDLANAPLMTLESAAEEGNQGDYESIITQIKNEKEMVDEAGIAPVNHGGAQKQDSEDNKPPEDTGDGS
jgi:capsid protein